MRFRHSRRWAGLLLLLMTSGLILLPACSRSERRQPEAGNPYTILLLPLDSRPVNTQHVELLAKLAGCELLQPPTHLLDNYTHPGDTAGLLDWLEQHLGQVDAAIIATNNLLTGGLIASRHPESYLGANDKLDQLDHLLRRYPSMDIALINVLPRQLPTQFSNPGWVYRQQLSRYGQLTDKMAQGLASPAERAELATITQNLPAQVLRDYNSVFNSNRSIDVRLIRLLESGAVDRLVLTLDDAAPFGLANQVQRELLQLAAIQGVDDQVFALTGADETSMLALARLVATTQGVTPSFQLHYERPSDARMVIRLETRPLNVTIAEKIIFVGGTIAEQQAENQLFVHARAGTVAVPSTALELIEYHSQGKQTGVLDVALVNQSDVGFTDALFLAATATAIDSYAGWNTASNSIGSVVAHLAVRSAVHQQIAWSSPTSTELRARLQADLEYRFLHVADEVGYLALVKPQLTKWVASQRISADQIPAGQLPAVTTRLAELMQPHMLIWATRFTGPITYQWDSERSTTLQVAGWQWQVSLPWPRLFELKVVPMVEFQP